MEREDIVPVGETSNRLDKLEFDDTVEEAIVDNHSYSYDYYYYCSDDFDNSLAMSSTEDFDMNYYCYWNLNECFDRIDNVRFLLV